MPVDRLAARRRPAHLAVFDATTLVAEGVKEQLVERSFPVASMRLFSTRSGDEAGLSEFAGEAMLVGSPELDALGSLDIAFLCGSREEGARYLEWAGRRGFVAIDLTTAASRSADVPLVNSMVNPETIPADPVLIATPHAISLFLSSLLAPLRECGLQQASIVAFQPASLSGERGIEELYRQTTGLLNFHEVPHQVFPRQLAFNLIPSSFVPLDSEVDGLRSDDVTSEVSRVLGGSLAVSVEVIQAPVFHCQAAMARVVLERGRKQEDLLAACRRSGDVVVDDGGMGATPVDRAGKAGVLLAGVRAAETESSFWVWALCDDKLSGNGLNAVRIAETVLAGRARGRATT
jgi:aspartate-semialdehyde dehydrogenase